MPEEIMLRMAQAENTRSRAGRGNQR